MSLSRSSTAPKTSSRSAATAKTNSGEKNGLFKQACDSWMPRQADKWPGPSSPGRSTLTWVRTACLVAKRRTQRTISDQLDARRANEIQKARVSQRIVVRDAVAPSLRCDSPELRGVGRRMDQEMRYTGRQTLDGLTQLDGSRR